MTGQGDEVTSGGMRGGRARAWLAGLRKWPVHPQWLLGSRDEARDLARTLSRFEGTVLDIGCADRRLARLLPRGCCYVGLDYPDTAIGMYGTRPEVFADAGRLPFADATIDCVILKDVLEHVYGPQQALAEIGRVLRPRGRLMLWMPFLYPIHDAPHDYQRFTRHGLVAYLAEQGFEVEAVKSVLGGIQTAGLLASLALADAGERIATRRRILLPLLPAIGALVVVSNLGARALAWLPGTDFMPAFYRVVATRKEG